MRFLGPWLVIVGCTITGILFEAVSRHRVLQYLGLPPLLHHAASLTLLLALEVAVFVLWAVYWTWLYPSYLTPFIHLPTPPKRWFLKGNRDEFFPANPWFSLIEIARTVPNNGLIRYYGPTNLERIMITSADGLRDALVVNAFDFDHESLVKLATKRFTGSELAELTNEEFKVARQSGGFILTVLLSGLAPTFFSTAVRMVQAINRRMQENPGIPVPLHDFVNRATLDNIGIAGMGYQFRALENPNSEDFAMFHKLCVEPTEFFNWVELMSHYISFNWLLYVPFPKNIEVLQGARYLRNLARRVIDEKKARLVAGKCEDHEKTDIVSVALASGGGIEPGIMVDHIMTLIQGGQESTAATYSWAIYELARRPAMQRRLRDEIREHLGPSLETAHGANINDLPYLSAVCNEALRFYPYMPIMLKEAVRDSQIVGERIPKGTIIVYSAYTINRDKGLWGPDADEFNPDRWMAPGAAKTGGATTNFALTTFGHGPRGCFGQNFARVFLPCLVAAIVGRYEIELAPESEAGTVKFGLRNIPESLWAKLTPIEGW